jgi:hypothetical protein
LIQVNNEKGGQNDPRNGASPLKRGYKVPLLDEAVPSCEYYPVNMDVERRLLSFTRISRHTYQNSAFLVPRHTNMGQRMYTFNLDDLLLRSMTSPLVCARTHYILISAFCCSTLLARYLSEVANCLVLKEPAMVAQVGFLRYRNWQNANEEWQSEWRQLAKLGLGLMSRAFSAEETVVIKPSDIGNCIGDIILDLDPRSRALLLSVSLRTFILSVLKADSRRNWIRGRARFWKPVLSAFPPLAAVDLKTLDDAKLSAYVWLITNAFWAQLRKGVSPGRVRFMDGEQVASSAAEALTQILSFFSLPCDTDEVARITQGETASRHAKRPGTRYDASTRNADLQDWELRFADEANLAIEWANRIARELKLGAIDGPVAEAVADPLPPTLAVCGVA